MGKNPEGVALEIKGSYNKNSVMLNKEILLKSVPNAFGINSANEVE
jgi:hypothetical protein